MYYIVHLHLAFSQAIETLFHLESLYLIFHFSKKYLSALISVYFNYSWFFLISLFNIFVHYSSLDKDKKSRRGKTGLSSRHGSMKSSISEDNEESPPLSKRTRKKSESSVMMTAGTTVSVINTVSSTITTSTTTTLG